MDSKLEEKNLKLSEADKRKEDIEQETSGKLAQLKEKEISLMTTVDVIRKEKQELEIEKRRFNSVQSLYN